MKYSWLLMAASLLIVYAAAVYDNIAWPFLGIGLPVALFVLAMRFWPAPSSRGKEEDTGDKVLVSVKDSCAPQNIAPTTQVVDLSTRVEFDPDGVTAPMSDGMLNWLAQQYFKNGIGTEFYRPRS